MSLDPNKIFIIFKKSFGPLNWWPIDLEYHKKNKSDPRYEIILGAILTQNTAWSNVEKALEKLKSQNKLKIDDILKTEIDTLKQLIKPSGFYNQKAERIITVSSYLHDKYRSNLDNFFKRDASIIRKELLSLKGIGPETADSILLYAGDKPIFVVDEYTKRLCKRLPLEVKINYSDIQKYFQDFLAKKYEEKKLSIVYNELHAQIVNIAKIYCKKKPNCTKCPLAKKCNFS
jgi:endonuclease-3 related protein